MHITCTTYTCMYTVNVREVSQNRLNFGEKSENFERYTKISTSFFIQEISRSCRVCCFVVPLEYGRCIVRNLVNNYFFLQYFGMAYLKAHEHLSASHWIISYIVDIELSHLCNEWNVAMTSRVLNNIGKVQDRSRPNTDLCKEAWSCAIVFKQILYHTISMSKT